MKILAQARVSDLTHASPHPRGPRTSWANTGQYGLSSHGVIWRFLAACWSSDALLAIVLSDLGRVRFPSSAPAWVVTLYRPWYIPAVVNANRRGSGVGWLVTAAGQRLPALDGLTFATMPSVSKSDGLFERARLGVVSRVSGRVVTALALLLYPVSG